MARNGSRTLPNHLEKLKAEKRERKRDIFYLILAFLKENYLEESAERLAKEAQLDGTWRTCDNVDLEVILQDYHSYYYTKFQKYPKILHKCDETIKYSRKSSKIERPSDEALLKENDDDVIPDFSFHIVPLNNNGEKTQQAGNQTKWHDCIGLNDAIEVLKETTIYPLRYPEIFRTVTSWGGVLLYGPPGTGKTLLARAVASEGGTAFFNVTCSSFVSKWRGESEKLLKRLFEDAKAHAPSTIFIDEIDSLVGSAVQHEASRRFRSELLTHIDGLLPMEERIVMLASTNSPWNLDEALLRRFDKRILVDLPDKASRIRLLRHFLKNDLTKLSGEELQQFGAKTEGYSGSDIRNVCKEISMGVAREKIQALERGDKVVNRAIEFKDVLRAVQCVKPATTVCEKYYRWKSDHGAT